MKDQGYIDFMINKHTELWKSCNAKNQKYNYGVLISKTWYWHETWLHEVEKYCKTHAKNRKNRANL